MIWWWWFSFCPDLLTPEGVLWYQELSTWSVGSDHLAQPESSRSATLRPVHCCLLMDSDHCGPGPAIRVVQ